MKDNKFYTLGEIEDKYIGKKGTPKRDKYEVDLQTDVHSHFIGCLLYTSPSPRDA